MDLQSMQMLAGFTSSAIFIASNLPMLYKAYRTRNLRSYSLGHIGLANLGNLIHWLYVATLPAGPIWWLHGFNTLVAVLMLAGYLRDDGPRPAARPDQHLRRGAGMMPQAFLCLLLAACPDMQFSVDGLLIGVNKVTVRWSLCGTHTCPLLELAPTGRPVNLKGVSTYRMLNGTPLECRDDVDIGSVLAQLGATPG